MSVEAYMPVPKERTTTEWSPEKLVALSAVSGGAKE